VPISNVIAAVFAAFLVTQVAIFITTVYLHRALTHRALTIHPAVALPFRTVIWMTTGMRPREWVAVHRKHHAATDTVDDPHSPKQVGFWRVQLGNVGLYKKVAADAANTSKYARDIPPDRLDRLAFDYSLLGLGVGTTILIVTMWALGFGLLTGLLAAGLHAVFYVMLSGAINAIGHTAGKQPYENSATNLQSLEFITAGEGLHNNHHAAPTSARLGHRWWEVDFGWWAISVFRAVGLAKVRLERVVLVTPKDRDPVAA
jgi:stearoyl-CoA desaturase (delta-9 desaturase)